MRINRTTEELAKDWMRTRQRVESAKRDLNRAECELLNAQNELGKRLAPRDMVVGEKVSVWTRIDSVTEKLVEATKVEAHTFTLRIRQ